MERGETRGGAGMSYRIEWVVSAEREFLRLPKAERRRIGERVEALAEKPRPAGCVKLSGVANLWRIRVGDYRVIYAIHDAVEVLTITRVGHRRDVYR